MRLNEEVLERIDELFDLVAHGEHEMNLVDRMTSLRRFLELDIDGVTTWSAHELATVTIHRLQEIWEQYSESHSDSELHGHFTDFIWALERLQFRDELEDEEIAEEKEIET